MHETRAGTPGRRASSAGRLAALDATPKFVRSVLGGGAPFRPAGLPGLPVTLRAGALTGFQPLLH